MHGRPDFTVGGALRQTWGLVRRRFGTLLALSALLYAVPVALVGLAPTLGLTPTAEALQGAVAAGRPVPSSAAGALIVYGVASALVLFAGNLLATAAAIWVCHEDVYRRPAGFAGGAGRGFRVLPANLAMIVLLTLGVMLFLRWSVAVPALVVERAGILGSLGRSRDLTRGHRWAILGFLLVMALVNGAVFGGLSFAIGLLGAAAGGVGGRAASVLAGLAMNAGFAALAAAASAALYLELRRAAEGTLSADTVEAFA